MWQPLKKVLEEGTKCKEMARLYIDYRPSQEEEFLLSTGGRICNVRQEALSYHPWLFEKNKVILVATSVTKFVLELTGQNGYDEAKKILRMYNEYLYSNKELEASGIAMNKDIFFCLPAELRSVGKEYWIDSIFKANNTCGVHSVSQFGDIKSNVLYDFKESKKYSYEIALLPVIMLSRNTLVELGIRDKDGSSPERAMSIRLPSKERFGVGDEEKFSRKSPAKK